MHASKRAEESAQHVIAQRLAARSEAALADLEERFRAGFDLVAEAQAERIRAALARLLECAAQLDRDGLIVVGSTGQPRSHQLLKAEQELRREISDGLQQLAHRVESDAVFRQAQAISRKQRQAARAAGAAEAAEAASRPPAEPRARSRKATEETRLS